MRNYLIGYHPDICLDNVFIQAQPLFTIIVSLERLLPDAMGRKIQFNGDMMP